MLQRQHICSFSEKAIDALNGFYVYALMDPRDNKVFYVGKGTGNRVFSHEIESNKLPEVERFKLKKIREIEATLINLLNYLPDVQLANEVSGHHVHEALSVEEFEKQHGAIPLEAEDIKHSILVIKINKLYRRGMSEDELYDAVRGCWAASLKSIKAREVEYVFGIYNGLSVAVYKPDEWHYLREKIDPPQIDLLKPEDFDKSGNRVYFICKDYHNLDEEGQFYLYKSIANLKVNQSAQNPITYISPICDE